MRRVLRMLILISFGLLIIVSVALKFTGLRFMFMPHWLALLAGLVLTVGTLGRCGC